MEIEKLDAHTETYINNLEYKIFNLETKYMLLGETMLNRQKAHNRWLFILTAMVIAILIYIS